MHNLANDRSKILGMPLHKLDLFQRVYSAAHSCAQTLLGNLRQSRQGD